MNSRSIWFCTGAFVLALLVMPGWSGAQEPIKIGFISVFSGRLATYGSAARQGLEMAMEEINAEGGIDGRKLVAVYEDDQMNPLVAASAARKLVTEHRVDVIMGIVSSEVAKAVAPLMKELQTPLITTLAMTPDITGNECNPYVFRVTTNIAQNAKGAAELAAGMKVRAWTTIGPDYVYGRQCWDYFRDNLRRKRPDVQFAVSEETVFVPLEASDFRAPIARLKELKHDGIFVSLYGGALTDFVRQAAAAGLFEGKSQFIMTLAYSNDVIRTLGQDMPKGVWLGGLYWFQANDAPANTKFVDAYVAKYRVFPDFNSHGPYCGIKTYVAALRKAGTTDKEKVVKALEGLSVELPVGQVTIRAEDHQAIVDGVWGLTDEYDSKWRCRNLKPMKIFMGQDIAESVQETGCRMR